MYGDHGINVGNLSGAPQAGTVLSGRSIAPGLGMGRAWVVGDVLKCGGKRGRFSPIKLTTNWLG